MPQPEPSRSLDLFTGIEPARRTWVLFLVSVLGLFLELMLIRWIGTEVRIFAYLQNTVLVVCFLGLGLGCMTCRKPIVIRDMLWPLVVLVVLLALPISRGFLGKITGMLTVLSDFLIWSNGETANSVPAIVPVAIGLCMTFFLLVLIWEIFVPLGRLIGRLFDDHPKILWAYSVNVAGGLIGIWLYVLLSALSLPPVAWVAVSAVMLAGLIALGRNGRVPKLEAGLLVALVVSAWVAGIEPGAIETRWSPYQKLVLWQTRPGETGLYGIGKYLVTVNNAGYQGMIDLSEKNVAAHPEVFPPEMRGLSQYDIPFLFHKDPRTALIVGAGSGNDAAGALRNGVVRVTAVEIDPVIIKLGRTYHPERPYDSPRVELINDDARSYFATSSKKFDVITFGLLDSHTTTAMTNARLDHYVYTRESLERARALLADGGIMVLSFEAQKPFVGDRMERAIREVFGQEPICFRVPVTQYGWGGLIFVAGNLDGAREQVAANPRLAGAIAKWQQDNPVVLTGTTPIATDDWPYIYLRSARVPTLYYLLAALMALLMVRCARRLELRGLVIGWRSEAWHFFFLGAAFLLLEVQNISKASVVLGNTWLVSAVIISGILAMVLVANLVVARLPKLPTLWVYGGLFLICLLLGVTDVARFAFLPYGLKALVVGGLTSLPMLFSGVIFARSFLNAARKDEALGANLIGALVGGLLQSITFVVGIRALLGIIAGFYLAAMLTRTKGVLAAESSSRLRPRGKFKAAPNLVVGREEAVEPVGEVVTRR